MTYHIEQRNLDGNGPKATRVYPVESRSAHDYWTSVTDVPCPSGCGGTVRWAEAGYVPGYRICDGCGAHWLADGNAEAPTLVRVGSRRSKVTKAGRRP